MKTGTWLPLRHRLLKVLMHRETDKELKRLKPGKRIGRFRKPRLSAVRYKWTRRRGQLFLQIIPTAFICYFKSEGTVRMNYLDLKAPMVRFPKLTIKTKRRPACKTTRARR